MAGSLFLVGMIDMRVGQESSPYRPPHSDVMGVSLLIFTLLSSGEAHAASQEHPVHTCISSLSPSSSAGKIKKSSSTGRPTAEGGRGDPWLALPTCGDTPHVLPLTLHTGHRQRPLPFVTFQGLRLRFHDNSAQSAGP